MISMCYYHVAFSQKKKPLLLWRICTLLACHPRILTEVSVPVHIYKHYYYHCLSILESHRSPPASQSFRQVQKRQTCRNAA